MTDADRRGATVEAVGHANGARRRAAAAGDGPGDSDRLAHVGRVGRTAREIDPARILIGV